MSGHSCVTIPHRMRDSREKQLPHHLIRRWFPYGAAGAGLVVLLVLTIVVTSKEDTTNTESALWTFILFGIGIALSFYFGRKSINEAATELVRPQARGAARRLVTLGFGVGEFRPLIERHRRQAQAEADGRGTVPLSNVELAYDVLLGHMQMQIWSISDALEDWREFEPEIVNQLEENLRDVRRARTES